MTRAPVLLRLALVGIIFTTMGCASVEYKFVPIEDQENATRNRGVIIYAEPPDSPTGRVRVMSLGVTDIESKSGEKVNALHIRMVISNRKTTPWILNTKEVEVAFPNQPPIQPTWVNSDDTHLPSLEVLEGQMRAVDFYFQLPRSMQSAEDIPEFDFHWKIQAGSEKVAESTPFDRVKILPSVATMYPYGGYFYGGYPYGLGLGWGQTWWGYPFFYPG